MGLPAKPEDKKIIKKKKKNHKSQSSDVSHWTGAGWGDLGWWKMFCLVEEQI